MTPELIADYGCATGENPLWHAAERRIYWVDIPGARLFRYDPATGSHCQVLEGMVVGGFTLQADGALLLFGRGGAVKTWREGRLCTVIEEIPAERKGRFNDVIADPEGRVFCGTLGRGGGRLYRLDPDGTLTVMLEGVGCSNGMGFTPDLARMYYTDSEAHEIYVFDYDRATGALSNKRLFVRVEDALPDGLTVDAEGCVWSAMWGGARLVRYAPDGGELLRVGFPVKKVSSVAFGGTDYAEAYVTTAGGDRKQEEGAAAGALFRLRPGVRGVPEFVSRIGLC